MVAAGDVVLDTCVAVVAWCPNRPRDPPDYDNMHTGLDHSSYRTEVRFAILDTHTPSTDPLPDPMAEPFNKKASKAAAT